MPHENVLAFRVHQEDFALDLLCIQEILAVPEATRVDAAPPYLHGLINLRGQVIALLDLAVKLGLPPQEIGPESRCLILKPFDRIQQMAGYRDAQLEASGEVVGLVVSAVKGIVSTLEQGLQPPPASAERVGREEVEALIPAPNALYGLLDLSRLVQP